MTPAGKSRKSLRQARPWWSQRRNRNKVWLGLLAVAVVAALGTFVSLRSGNDEGASSQSSRFPSIYTFTTADLHALAFDPANPDRLLFGHHSGVMASNDRGRSWSDLVDQQNFDGMNLVFDPQQASTLYLAGHNVLSSSTDGGTTWKAQGNDLPGLDLHGFGASPSKPGRFYAFAGGRGLFQSDGGPSSWTPLWAGAPPGTHSIVEVADGVLVLGAADNGILRSEDAGKTWVDSRTGIDGGVIFSVKADLRATKLYAGTSNGLYVSTDGGRSWSPTAFNDTMVLTVGVDPADADQVTVISRSGELYRSSDGGATWSGGEGT